jgi:hypothetical protein
MLQRYQHTRPLQINFAHVDVARLFLGWRDANLTTARAQAEYNFTSTQICQKYLKENSSARRLVLKLTMMSPNPAIRNEK